MFILSRYKGGACLIQYSHLIVGPLDPSLLIVALKVYVGVLGRYFIKTIR